MCIFSKSLALILVAGSAALLFVGCSSSGNDRPSHSSVATKPYPLNKCLVTDEGFNHGKPYTFVHQGQEIKLCCEDCLTDFKKDPAKYLSKLKTPK